MNEFTKQYNDAVMDAIWYPVVNDLIGGWCVSTVDKPLSSLEHGQGYYIVAETTTLEAAQYIACLHNERQYGL